MASYGINLEHQDELINKMSNFILEMQVNGKKTLFLFKKVVILYLIIKYKYILFY